MKSIWPIEEKLSKDHESYDVCKMMQLWETKQHIPSISFLLSSTVKLIVQLSFSLSFLTMFYNDSYFINAINVSTYRSNAGPTSLSIVDCIDLLPCSSIFSKLTGNNRINNLGNSTRTDSFASEVN